MIAPLPAFVDAILTYDVPLTREGAINLAHSVSIFLRSFAAQRRIQVDPWGEAGVGGRSSPGVPVPRSWVAGGPCRVARNGWNVIVVYPVESWGVGFVACEAFVGLWHVRFCGLRWRLSDRCRVDTSS